MVANMVTAQLTPVGVGIHNVLIATDFSRHSKVALDFGLELAHRDQVQAYVVFVVPSDEFLMAGPEAYQAAKEAARRDLLELKYELRKAHSYEEGEDYHLFLLEGEVTQSVLDFAHQKHIDLIVVGTHGRSGLGKMLMGSVAERIFRQSPVPVVTVGPQLHRLSRGLAPKNILLAADFSTASERAVRYASVLASEHGAKLTLLHVLEQAELKGLAGREHAMPLIEEKLAGLLAEDHGNLKFCCRTEVGRVVPTILHTAAEIEADLLVMGVRPWTGLLDRLMWPHAYAVVREAPCPVLTVRG